MIQENIATLQQISPFVRAHASLLRRRASGPSLARLILGSISQLIAWFESRSRLRRAEYELTAMNDRMLRDIGLTRADTYYAYYALPCGLAGRRGNVAWRVAEPAEDIHKRDGSSISPTEVENALNNHPAVREAAVFGAPDEVLGERVIALVELNCDASREAVDDMIAKAREQFADCRLPGTLKLVDSIARNALGKIDRKALLATLESGG